ncbi:T9SS type A sorting domain-containing protein, partial [bacterium]|nr:T9SS type A sorting domain-containing protein [bacterium]
AAVEFAKKYGPLFPVSLENMRISRVENILGKWYVSLQQCIDDIDVLSASAELRINSDGEIFLFRSTQKPIANNIDTNPTISINGAYHSVLQYVGASEGEMLESHLNIAPIPKKDHYEGKLIWWLEVRTKNPLGLWIAWIDAHTGEIVRILDEMPTVTGTVIGQYKPSYIDEDSVFGAFPYLHIAVDGDHEYTDSSGNFSAGGTGSGSHTFYAELEGTYCEINDDSYPRSNYNDAFSGATYNFQWGEPDARENQLNAYYHVNFIHDYVKNFLGYSAMDYSVPTLVNDSSMPDNAYWDGTGVNFGVSGETMYDLAMFSDVIYHEYTHGVTHHIYPSGALPYDGQSGAIDEGLSDYFPCSIHNDSRMGERCFIDNPSAYMRELNNSNRYPDDFVGEVHYDGQIIAGAWWDVRSSLGANYTDTLVHFSRFGHPADFESFLYEMLAVDDDDGDLSNGTPNCGAIYTSYYDHGIGPDTLLFIEHTPHRDVEDTTGTYTISVRVTSLLGLDSISLCYRVNYSSWSSLEMVPVLNTYEGYIPAQSRGSMIHYYIYTEDIAGNSLTSPSGAPATFYSFFVIVDTIPPEIHHIPLSRGCFNAWSPNVAAQINDNMDISEAKIEYSINGIPQPDAEMEYDAEKDIWGGHFGSDIEVGDEISYRISATDVSAAGNTAIYPSDDSWISFVVQQDYYEDVESGGYDYSHTNGTFDYGDEWHIETSRAHSGGYSFKCGGEGTEDYNNLVDAILETPEMVASYNDTFSFFYWADIETSTTYSGYAWDGGIIEMSIDGGISWSQKTPLDGYPFITRYNPVSPFDAGTPCFSGRRNWQQAKFLVGYYGAVKFRFHFGSDGYVTGEGWYIDDIRLTNIEGVSVFDGKEWKPEKLSISASPNPFNAATKISIAVPENGFVSVDIFDISGKLRENIFSDDAHSGIFKIVWKPKTLSSGIYFVRASCSGGKSTTAKLLLIK